VAAPVAGDGGDELAALECQQRRSPRRPHGRRAGHVAEHGDLTEALARPLVAAKDAVFEYLDLALLDQVEESPGSPWSMWGEVDQQADPDRLQGADGGAQPDQRRDERERLGEQPARRVAVAAESAALVRSLHVGLQEKVSDEMRNDEHGKYLDPGHRAGNVS
jgi:hypothetical protein